MAIQYKTNAGKITNNNRNNMSGAHHPWLLNMLKTKCPGVGTKKESKCPAPGIVAFLFFFYFFLFFYYFFFIYLFATLQ